MINKKKVVLLALLMVVTIFSAVELFSASTTITISSKGVANVEQTPTSVHYWCNPINNNDCSISIVNQQ